MGTVDYKSCLDDALRKAFAAREPKVRLAYMELAEFYQRQVQRTSALGAPATSFSGRRFT